MNPADVADRLKGTRTPTGWAARCPAHEDKNASLTITEGADGRTLLKCHAGCAFPAIVAAMGLKPADLFNESPRPQHKPKHKQGPKIHTTEDDATKAAQWGVKQQTEREHREAGRWHYQDAEGQAVAAMIRFEDADRIKTYRPITKEPNGWRTGDPAGKWPLYGIQNIITTKRGVIVAEGEKCADAILALGITATTSAHGAKSPHKTDWSPLAGRDVAILPDNDKAGKDYFQTVASILSSLTPPTRIRRVDLPGLADLGKGADVVDWLQAGHSKEELQGTVRAAPLWEPPSEPEKEHATNTTPNAADGKPIVILPHGAQSISESGRALGELLAKTERFFIRGGAVVKLLKETDGLPVLGDVKPATLASDFEAVAILCKVDGIGKDGTPNLKATTCPEQTAKVIAVSTAFREIMPPITVLTRCPVLIERAGSLIQVAGYDRESGIYAAGKPAEPMAIENARRLLCEVLDGFKFATPADRARALAAMITPALVFGGLLRGRAPVDLGEADASQTGKGYRNKLTAALYSQSVRTITQQKAGVGSLEESFNAALIRGANFIALDNIRGKIDSPAFESFLTEETYSARMPYREPVEIDPRRVLIMLTSNKADVTTDLANRSSCVRILKQADGYTFKTYPEGDILEHVRANQPRYLGAVFSIVKAWYEAGKPRTVESRHDFRPWAQSLDWITRNLLEAGPLLDGHRETQARMTNPVLGWLREVAIEVVKAKQAGAWLRASDIIDFISETGIETPGLPEHGDLSSPTTRSTAQQATGRKLGLCFRAGDTISLDGMTIDRQETYETASRYTSKEYRFTLAAMTPAPIAATLPPTPEPPAGKLTQVELCGYETQFCGYGAANDAAIKPQYAANAADVLRMGEDKGIFSEREGGNGDFIECMGTISRIAATEDEINTALHAAAMVQTEEGEI